MKRVVIYGAGGTGGKIFELVKDNAKVIVFSDSDPAKWGDVRFQCKARSGLWRILSIIM